MSELRASVTTDGNGWFKAVSPAFLELIGRPVESLAGVNLVDLMHPLDAAQVRRLLGQAGSGEATAPVRVFGAGDTWQPTQFTARTAGEGRITVELVATVTAVAPATLGATESVAPAVAPAAIAPLAATEPRAAAAPFPSPTRAAQVWSVADATAFAAPGSTQDATDAETFAGADVPAQRSAVRESVDSGVAMIEIDADGRTTFATGSWDTLSTTGSHGASAFEEFLERTGTAEVVLDLVAEVTANGQPRQTEAVLLEASHWIQVLPIPSPHRANSLHALVAVVADKSDGELVAGPASAGAAAVAEPAAVTPAVPEPSPEPELEPAAVAAEEPEADPVETDTGMAADIDTDAEPETEATDDADAERSGRGFFGWLALAIAALLLVVIVSKLWPSGDGAPSTGPVTVEIVNADPVEIAPGQTWRPTGVGSLGEAHGIAATNNGAYVAGVRGTIVRLDADGAAVSAVTLGGDETSFVSDIDADSSGTVWALDAGQGRLFRVNADDNVTEVITDSIPLRNARGIGVSSDGMAWIASTASAQLTKISADGAADLIIPLPTRQPSDVVDVGDGTLWMVDSQELELVHLNLAGEVLRTIELGAFTSLNSPHLAIADESLWVTDPEMSVVIEVDLATGEATGEEILLLRPADVRVNKPIGISADDQGRLWIIDSTGGATIILDN